MPTYNLKKPKKHPNKVSGVFIPFAATCLFLSSCANKKTENVAKISVTERIETKQGLACDTCNKRIIERLIEQSYNVDYNTLQEFYCSIDSSCDFLNNQFLYTGAEGTYREIMQELLILQIHRDFENSMNIISQLSRAHQGQILFFIDNVDKYRDYPYSDIRDSISSFKGNSLLKKELLAILKGKL